MNTLYYFSLNPDVGTLSRREINDYEIVKHSWNPSRDSISFSGKYGAKTRRDYSIEVRDLDKFLHNRVITYDPDPDHALKIIKDSLNAKINYFKDKMEQYNNLYLSIFYNEE